MDLIELDRNLFLCLEDFDGVDSEMNKLYDSLRLIEGVEEIFDSHYWHDRKTVYPIDNNGIPLNDTNYNKTLVGIQLYCEGMLRIINDLSECEIPSDFKSDVDEMNQYINKAIDKIKQLSGFNDLVPLQTKAFNCLATFNQLKQEFYQACPPNIQSMMDRGNWNSDTFQKILEIEVASENIDTVKSRLSVVYDLMRVSLNCLEDIETLKEKPQGIDPIITKFKQLIEPMMAEIFPHLPNKPPVANRAIEVRKDGKYYIAYLMANNKYWCAAENPDEAIGGLVRTYHYLFLPSPVNFV